MDRGGWQATVHGGHKGSDMAQLLTHMRFPKLASGRQERHGEWQELDSGEGGTTLYR